MMPPARPSADDLAFFADRLGPKGFTTDAHAMAPWLTDWRGVHHGAAAALLSPASTAEVAIIVRHADERGLALVPQGGNSGMVAGATPDGSGDQLLLSLRRMNRIRSLDADAGLAVAEAGVILQHLHEAAAQAGMRFPLTLGGKGSATIGGLVSTNAGGTQVLRHGTMRALVAGVEAVLADGQIYSSLAALKKDNRGYAIGELLVGAEGTLGIVTAATVRLAPAIGHRSVAWVAVASPHAALALLHHVQRRLGPALEGFEIVPDLALTSVLRHIPGTRAPLATPSPWHVLIEAVSGAGDPPPDLLGALEAALDAGLISDAALAKAESEADAFWHLRDSISEAERAEWPSLQHDVSVPVARMPDYIAASEAELARHYPGIRLLAFGHLGDGNVHHHLGAPPVEDPRGWLAATGHEASRRLYDIVAQFGGSISAEHGIGLVKRDLLPDYAGAGHMAALRAIKAALDPKGILNPGKLIA